ncbi:MULTISPECIES: cytochrome c biogenesis protein CcsA [unclassified Kaistella]|uniref:cytochrome c biogenesis protein CcsA n=1 Tax=unclassified Kaistella TaxID=2762626 RepID=UPI002735ED97|nr:MULTISPECIES: cytochrome c biogenesis protein CcsA [unclassified Kaistella]MDP2454518.1 cytochrome c biogenesis protein CcsA [Kaistella sp. SH11-4b]MDP2457256.1 cytochrome c biogenesis protein CcsA [Kaistella sp. SH40-3]MDP2460016.1 cytochrome c biogenesis protein CcsA [Kaistella sp. SH19-2b]
MKKIQSILISTRTMAVLLLVYAASMGYATFLENDYGTPTAKALIYDAKWFELVMLLLIFNFIGNISRYRLWRREKWPVLVFHLSFILIFLGGAVTRYISFEGVMHIREGETSNEIITDKNFFKIQIEEKGDVLNYEDIPYLMSPLHKNFKATYQFHDNKISVKALDYIQRKKDSIVLNPSGTEYLHLVSTGQSGRENIYIKPGDSKLVNGMLVSFNRAIDGAVEFNNTNGTLLIKTPVESEYMTMATQAKGMTKKDEYEPLVLRSLYTINDLKLVVPEGLMKGNLIAYEGDRKKDANVSDNLKVEVQGPKSKLIVDLPVEKGNPNAFKQVSLDGMNIMLGFGPKVYKTPFSLKLEKFVMETYPGSSSPSAYESHVQIIEKGKQTPYKIYMNHVLNHEGYRFFQSSFDPDRKGTVLSVNHDFWGTLLTYIGYFFLFGGMFVIFFWKGTHFWKLNQMLKNVSKKKAATLLLILLTLNFNAQYIETHGNTDGSGAPVHSADDGHDHGAADLLNEDAAPQKQQKVGMLRSPKPITADEIIARNKIPKEHADKFGYLLVQNYEGRIVPMNTQALDVLRKLYKHDKFNGTDGKSMTAEQWFLSINTDTASWTMVPIIRVGSKGGEELRKKTKAIYKDHKALGDEYYTSLMSLFPADNTGALHYVLEKDYQEAFRKKPADQTNYDKEVIAVNDRVQAFNEFFSGQFMRIVPVKNDPNNTWHSWLDQNFEPDTASQEVMGPYFSEVLAAQKSGDWSKADAELVKLEQYQKTWGKNVVPNETKVNLEVFMNKANINFYLLMFYSVIGGLILLLGFFELFKPNKILNKIIKGLILVGLIGYFAQFLGLVGRWYISGHAPWSNGYEAIIFISWVGITAGLLLYRNSNALIPAAGFMVAVIMMGFAHGGSALDPQITPLVPVLKSYWLIIHVAIIVSSYGFFGLSMVIAIITLFFYIFSDKKTYKVHHDTTIKELTIVSEMSLTIGLYALTVGTFLGGIWANESWGRYWSWDPKETWAFISVMVYAFVLHMRLVPGLRGRWAFHVASLFSISTIVMTYFGVNYYLSGLHSYAAGDPVPVPIWVYIGIAFMFTLAIVSYFRFKAINKK